MFGKLMSEGDRLFFGKKRRKKTRKGKRKGVSVSAIVRKVKASLRRGRSRRRY
jgi:hypothetical protein